MTEPKTGTMAVPGAVLRYDVRSSESSAHPALLIIGSPMGAAGFATLAGHFADRTVVTYDPRGSGRSQRTDDALETTPDEHAGDLALVARHPEQVRTLVAHEPPASRELPDSGPALAASVDIHDTYQRAGFGPAMAKFIALVSQEGPFLADYTDRPDIGDESRQMFPGRAAVVVAARLGAEPVTFPGGHDGFLGGEFGRTGKPDAFAATLRDVLDAT